MKNFAPTTICLIFLSGCLLVCDPVYAAFQLGEVEVTPIASVSETYDDNITEANVDEIDDLITTLSLGLDSRHESKNQIVALKGVVHQELYADNDDFNNLSEDITAALKHEYSKYDRLALKDTFVHADHSYSFQNSFGRSSGRYDSYQNTLGADYAHDFSEQWTMHLKYDQDYYDPHRSDLASSIEHKPGVEASYAISSQTKTSLFYTYTQRDFSGDRSLSKNSPGVGVRQYLSEQLYVDGKVAADFINPETGDDLVRPAIFVGLTDEVDETTVYGLSYTKEYADSPHSIDFFDSWKVALDWGKELRERLRGVISAFTGEGEYIASGIHARLNGVYVGLSYETTPRSNISLGYTYHKSDSDDLSREYEKNMVTVAFNFKF